MSAESVRGKLESMDTKLDMLILEFQNERKERRENCHERVAVTRDLEKRLDSLDHWKFYASGLAAAFLGMIMYLKEEIKSKFR